MVRASSTPPPCLLAGVQSPLLRVPAGPSPEPPRCCSPAVHQLRTCRSRRRCRPARARGCSARRRRRRRRRRCARGYWLPLLLQVRTGRGVHATGGCRAAGCGRAVASPSPCPTGGRARARARARAGSVTAGDGAQGVSGQRRPSKGGTGSTPLGTIRLPLPSEPSEASEPSEPSEVALLGVVVGLV